MLLVWGSGDGRSILGDLPEDVCPQCGQKAARTAFIDYKTWHLWYLFSLVTGRSYHLGCHACGAVLPYDPVEAKMHFAGDNIPFRKKYGWLICVALVAFFLGTGAITSHLDHRKAKAVIADPRPADIYLANLGKIPGSGYPQNRGSIYGAMFLMGHTHDDRYAFATSVNGFSKKSGLDKEMKKPAFVFSHNMHEPLVFTREELESLHDKSIIYKADRGVLGQYRVIEEGMGDEDEEEEEEESPEPEPEDKAEVA